MTLSRGDLARLPQPRPSSKSPIGRPELLELATHAALEWDERARKASLLLARRFCEWRARCNRLKAARLRAALIMQAGSRFL